MAHALPAIHRAETSVAPPTCHPAEHSQRRDAMKKRNIIFIAASSLMAIQVAVADNVMPTPIFADISPAYRTGDLHNYDGEVLVRVTEITGQDRDGQWVVLFRDKSGALLPMVDLDNIAMLINPNTIDNEGEYHNINVSLADTTLSINQSRVEQNPLPSKLKGKVLSMRGSIYVGEYEVSTSGLSF
jgi:hypothetical protein